MNWSEKQLAVFADAATGIGHTMVNAVAGGGKTTVLLEAMRHVPKGKSCCFVAFNKSIATELARRAPDGVEVSTLHSLGLRAVTRAIGRAKIDGDKCRTIADRVTGADADFARREWSRSVAKTVSLCKGQLAATDEEIEDVIDQHGSVPPEREEDHPSFVLDVQKVLQASLDDTKTIDFDDMIWLPSQLDIKPYQFDRVFCDEVQDLNAAQVDLVLRATRDGGRITCCGDPRQGIYAFRGAMAGAFEKIKNAFSAKELPLSVTYRCCRAVVQEAQKLVPHIEHAPTAEEGLVEDVDELRMMRDAKPGDFILSRINAPLLKLCLAFLKEGRKATIAGRDIGTRLVGIIRRSKARDVDAMLQYVDKWSAAEAERLEKRGRDATGIDDTRECLHALSEGETSLDEVVQKIERLFADGDDQNRIVLSSTHKAKGLERDRVWLLRDTYMRRRFKKVGGSFEPQPVDVSEANLLYVGVTRARRELYLVRGGV